jgi:hypothetical protein
MKRLLILLFCCALAGGCVTHRVISNTRKPEIVIDDYGRISLSGKTVERGKIAKAVRSAGFTQDQEINILIPDRPDRGLMASVAGELVKGGYKRTVFVKNRRAAGTLQQRDAPLDVSTPTKLGR